MHNNPLVIYHGPGCLDGKAAAWVLFSKFGLAAEYVVGRYQSDDEIDYANRDIYMVDFSYPRDKLCNIAAVANKVVVIDHHASAINDLKGLDLPNLELFMTNERSGCMLAWLYFYGELPPPKLLLHIEDRDLWKFEMKDTKKITAALFYLETDFRSLLPENSIEYLSELGRLLVDVNKKDCDMLLKIAKRQVVAAYFIPDLDGTLSMVNSPPKHSSDIGNALALECPIGITYYDSEKHREFSLRSDKSNPEWKDVSAIAKMFGGGGHTHAAGFKVTRDHYLARM